MRGEGFTKIILIGESPISSALFSTDLAASFQFLLFQSAYLGRISEKEQKCILCLNFELKPLECLEKSREVASQGVENLKFRIQKLEHNSKI